MTTTESSHYDFRVGVLSCISLTTKYIMKEHTFDHHIYS